MKPEVLEWDDNTVIRIADGMTQENFDALVKEKYDEVCLLGGDFDDLSAFAELNNKIKRLYVSGDGIYDLNGIYQLRQLKCLRLETCAKFLPDKQQLDFSEFPILEECHIFWRKEYSRNVFASPKLRTVVMFSYDKKTFEEIAQAKSLRSVSLLQSATENLKGIESLNSLESLEFYQMTKLSDIGNLPRLKRLKELKISKTRSLSLLSLLPIFEVPSLEYLSFGAGYEFPNLEPFAQLTSLKEFITSSQLVIQDFSPLFKLKKLKLARFIALRNFVADEKELRELAKSLGRKLKIEIIGKGRKEQTVTFMLS